MTASLFEWNDSFLIGIEELDHEHEVLIDNINQLHEELIGNENKSELRKCLGEIYVRMQAHFALEEHVMKENDYEFFDEHKREHEEFLESYTECMVQFLNGADILSRNPIDECLKQWVMEHITTSDRKMALMMQNKVA
ncbi:MAG TPA: hemerythrin family protein [Woeseiaceae bacterium]|nr:hemerythrin family protein [Woeseiaceae bacterium]